MKQFLGFKVTPAYGEHKVQDGGVAGTELAAAPDELAEGAVGIFAILNSGKLALVDSAAEFLDVKEFIVARGLAKGCVITDTIERKSLQVEKSPAVNGVKRVVTISAIPTNLPAGTLVEVGIVDNNVRVTTDTRVRRASYITKAANETAATIATALAASVNKKNFMVDATAPANDLVLTAKVAGKNFSAFVDEGLAIANVTVTTKQVKAGGDIATLEALQLDCHGYQGGTRRGNGETGDVADYNTIDKSQTSQILYNISWTGTTVRSAVATDAVALRHKRLYLAIPTGAAAITTLDSMLVAAAQEEVAAQAEEAGA
jgi:ribosome-associated translation inhibitor RaiA